MDVQNPQQQWASDAGDASQTPPMPQYTRRESDADTANQGSIDQATTLSVAKPRRSTYLRLSSTWWIEIITICISIAFMAGLVGILAGFQNRLTTDWSFFISLNAAVAIIITAARATLLATISACLSQEKWSHFNNKAHRLKDLGIIDRASRGPLGSINMLFQVSWGLASVSAIVMILSLFTDTFVQQVVYFEPGTVYAYQEGSATFGHAYEYRSGIEYTYSLTKSGGTTTVFTETTNPNLQAAVFKGLYQTNWPFAVNCTSNCTWDQPYLTLGFSNTCANVTEETLKSVQCQDFRTFDVPNIYATPCNMTTPQGVLFDFHPILSGPSIAINSSSGDIKAANASNTHLNAKNFSTAAVWTVPKITIDMAAADLTELLRNSTIVECAFDIVLYNYSDISFISNNFNIGVTKKIPLGKATGGTRSRQSGCGSSCDNSTMDTLIWWNNTGPGLPNTYLSWIDLDVFSNLLASPIFSGSTGENEDSYNPGSTAAFGNGSLEVVTGIFDNIALSMTDLIRQGDGMQLAQGKTSQAVVYIRVRWLWLILPIAVHALGGLALVGTVIGRQRNKDVPLWKGSALAVLYHSVDKDGVLGTQVKDLEELEELGTIQAMLEKDSGVTDT